MLPPLRTAVVAALAVACSSSGTTEAPAPHAEALAQLEAAVEAWRASPTSDAQRAVGVAAARLQDVPPGDASIDVPLGDALCNVVLRPDLGTPRLTAHAASLTDEAREILLDCQLRLGDLEAFSTTLQAHTGRAVDPESKALQTLSLQARRLPAVGWRTAVRGHDAAALADTRHPRGFRVERPVVVPRALDALVAMYPEHTVRAALTRSTDAQDDPLRDEGLVPAMGGRRQVLAYAADTDELPALTAALSERPNTRVLRVTAEVVDSAGDRVLLVCAEGSHQKGETWLTVACHPTLEIAWLAASEHFHDAVSAGQDPASAATEARTRLDAVVAGEAASP